MVWSKVSALVCSLLVVAAGCGQDAPNGESDAAAGAAVVVKVIDGDTIRVRVGGRDEPVRLIGIDTPETHGQGGLRECFGKEASNQTARLLPKGSEVRLVLDVEPRDRYGRLLAYVYKPDGRFVNMSLAHDGFAAPLTIPPNVAHSEAFAEAAANARNAGRGLWGACGGADTPLLRITEAPAP